MNADISFHIPPPPPPPPPLLPVPVPVGMLLPLPGESVESSALELGATSKTVGSSMAQLLTAANQGKISVLYMELGIALV